MGVSAEFSKFAGEGETKLAMCFGDVKTCVIMSAPECSQIGSLLVTKKRQRNTWLFFFNKLNEVKFDLSNFTAFAIAIRQRFTVEWQVNSARK